MKRLIDFDPLTQESVWMDVDEVNGTFDLHHSQPVEHILENNRRLANDTDYTKKGIKDDWWHYASIPNIVIQEWSKKVGGDILSKKYEKELFKFLNSPDYAYLRSTHGKHSAKSS